jgi:hypothetical protein
LYLFQHAGAMVQHHAPMRSTAPVTNQEKKKIGQKRPQKRPRCRILCPANYGVGTYVA